MIKRSNYLKTLLNYKDTSIIKVITGIRRCGKSILMKQYQELLISENVGKDQIIYVNFESLQYDELKDYKLLYEYVEKKIHRDKKCYILLDEIQKVSEWEKSLSSFQVDFDCDLYITGSNAYLLSSELSTLLSGRYVEIHVFPLSFKEYNTIENSLVKQEKFNQFIKYGGFPGLIEFEDISDVRLNYLEGIYNTVIVKDIIARTKVTDVDLLNRILCYLLDNVGNLISANKIANYLTTNSRKTATNTVVDYLKAFENAFVLYRAQRYRIKGKQLLQSPDKYYVVDVSLRSMVHSHEQYDIGRILENVVYIELIRRGYKVHVGADNKFEIDFIASLSDEKAYYQVSLSIADENVREREISGLLSIKDNYPKFLLTMDYRPEENIKGIQHKNIIDFLLE